MENTRDSVPEVPWMHIIMKLLFIASTSITIFSLVGNAFPGDPQNESVVFLLSLIASILLSKIFD